MTTTTDLKAIPGFIAWAEQGEAMGYLRALAQHIDERVGDTGIATTAPHDAHVNLGVQHATRECCKTLKDPLGRAAKPPTVPRPSYGVTDSDTETNPLKNLDWK